MREKRRGRIEVISNWISPVVHFSNNPIVDPDEAEGKEAEYWKVSEELTSSSAALHQNAERLSMGVVGSCGRGVVEFRRAHCVARLCGCPKWH